MELINLIKDDMKPALGVTEPGAIAYAVSKAVEYLNGGEIIKINLFLNSSMYKNGFTCGIPNSSFIGNEYAAALGAVAGDSSLELESLRNVNEEDNIKAKELVELKKVEVFLDEITPIIMIRVDVTTTNGNCILTIRDSHTNIVKIEKNNEVIYEKKSIKKEVNTENIEHLIHSYSLKDICKYVENISIDDIKFIDKAFKINLELFHEGLNNEKTKFIKYLYKDNYNKIISDDELKTAHLLCDGAIEARVMGLNKPAMSITGSGAHGIIATMPLYAVYKIRNLSKDLLLRATLLSFLVTTYIKEYSGKLSAFCGCAIAAGTGMACGLAYLNKLDYLDLEKIISNMASSITGMICDGGNQGCVMKSIAAIDIAFRSVDLAKKNVYIDKSHGINGKTVEETMKNMGLIASPGMIQTEKVIIDIFQNK